MLSIIHNNEKALLSILWIFLVVNLFFCELLSFMHCYASENQLISHLYGINMSRLVLLASAIMMEIPMIMILIARLCRRKCCRVLNIICSFLVIIIKIWSLNVNTTNNTPHQWFFFAIEIITCIFIIWIAFSWKKMKRIYVYDEEIKK